MSENKKAFLSVRDLVVEYTQSRKVVHAVNGVSFDLEKGKVLGLVGETGAGKTTIAKSILRILPDRAAKIKSGQIFLEGEDITRLPEEEMRKIRGRKISMIFQDPMTALNPLMTVGEQIEEVLRTHNKKMTKAELDQGVIRILELVGIAGERAAEYPHQFSGGMKQRVVIAMALSCDPMLLLADEPTTALDVTIQGQVLDLIKELQNKLNTSMVLITHDLGVVAEVCDEVAVIYAGEIVEQGELRAVYKNPSHPYTIGLFGSLPTMNSEGSRLYSIPGLPPDSINLPEGCSFHPRCERATAECCSLNIPLVEIEPGHFCRCCHPGKEEGSHGKDAIN